MAGWNYTWITTNAGDIGAQLDVFSRKGWDPFMATSCAVKEKINVTIFFRKEKPKRKQKAVGVAVVSEPRGPG